jgi:hypothetical protein
MKFNVLGACLGFVVLGCGVVGDHHDHEHGEEQVPLHRQEYVQDPVEELERKWGFEVSWDVFCSFLEFLFIDWCS